MYTDTRYVVATTLGKRLYVKREPKAAQKSNTKVEYAYSLTEDLKEATKCTNKETANTLIEYYVSETQSTKSFAPKKLIVNYELADEPDG